VPNRDKVQGLTKRAAHPAFDQDHDFQQIACLLRRTSIIIESAITTDEFDKAETEYCEASRSNSRNRVAEVEAEF
jgi:hypothetical protein